MTLEPSEQIFFGTSFISIKEPDFLVTQVKLKGLMSQGFSTMRSIYLLNNAMLGFTIINIITFYINIKQENLYFRYL